MKAIAATPEYEAGDPDTVAAYYRIHFKPALQRAEHLDQVIAKLRASFNGDGILKARAIEDRLMDETWYRERIRLAAEAHGSAHPDGGHLGRPRVRAGTVRCAHRIGDSGCATRDAEGVRAFRVSRMPRRGAQRHRRFLWCPPDARGR
jgi:hypothetical protein